MRTRTVVVSVAAVVIHTLSLANGSSKPDAPVPYSIEFDDMGTIISVVLPADVTEGQLRATLRGVADQHQDDAARDYLFSQYLWVEGHLRLGDCISEESAGRLRRFVPPGTADERKKLDGDRGRFDYFETMLEKARKGERRCGPPPRDVPSVE